MPKLKGTKDCSDIDIIVLYRMSYRFLRDKFPKFSQRDKIKVALKMMEKFADSQVDPDKGATYIYNDFRKRLEDAGPIGIREVMSGLRGEIRQG